MGLPGLPGQEKFFAKVITLTDFLRLKLFFFLLTLCTPGWSNDLETNTIQYNIALQYVDSQAS